MSWHENGGLTLIYAQKDLTRAGVWFGGPKVGGEAWDVEEAVCTWNEGAGSEEAGGEF